MAESTSGKKSVLEEQPGPSSRDLPPPPPPDNEQHGPSSSAVGPPPHSSATPRFCSATSSAWTTCTQDRSLRPAANIIRPQQVYPTQKLLLDCVCLLFAAERSWTVATAENVYVYLKMTKTIVHESTDSHSRLSALPTGSAPVLPTPTSLPATTPAATACPFSSPPITLAPPQQQLAFNLLTKKSSTTSSASVPPLPTTLTTTFSAATATAGSQTITPAAPEQQPILYERNTTSSGPRAVIPSTASAPPYITILPATLTTQTAGPSGEPAMTPAAPEQQLAVDERGIPGMDQVDSLAEYLVGLRSETGQTLSNQQASTIIALWQNLLQYDQQRVVYAARRQVRLTTGRFRCARKRPEFTPGVENTTRSLTCSGSPAQWPGCSLLVESICVKLCNIHKSPKKQGSYALTRWTLIVTDYRKIQQLVLGNATVMQSTTQQLFEISQTTLVQWNNKRLKRQGSSILLQGVNLPASIPVASAPLPPVQVSPAAAPPRPGPQHQYHLPHSTAGQAVVKRKSAAQRQLFPQPAPPPTSATLPVVPNLSPVIAPFIFLTPQVPGAQQIAPSGPLPSPPPARRAYTRTV